MSPLLLGALILEVLIQNIPNEYSYKKSYLDSNSNEIEVLFLGSSHVYYGVNPEYISANSFNASHIAQTLDYDYAILKKYESQWNNLKVIVIPVDYFSLFYTLETGTESWRVKNYNIYYDLNSRLSLVHNAEILSHSFRKTVSRIYRAYIRQEKNISWSPLGWGNSYHSDMKNDLTAAGKLAAQRHHKNNDQSFDANVKRLESIIAFAKSKNVATVIITSPAYKSYIENLDNRQLSRTITTVRDLADDPNVFYHNLLSDKTFIESDFYDADHLNQIGAKKFSIKLDSLVAIALNPKDRFDRDIRSISTENIAAP